MFKDMKLMTKLTGGFSLVASITLIIGIVGYMGISGAFQSLAEVTGRQLPGIEALSAVKEAHMEINGIEKILLIPELDAAGRKTQYSNFKSAWKRAEGGFKIYQSFPRNEEQDLLWKRFTMGWEKWKKDHQDYIRTYNKRDQGGNQLWEDISRQTMLVNQVSFQETELLLDEIIGLNGELTEEFKLSSENRVDRTKMIMIMSMIIGTIIALVFGIFLARSITKPIAMGVDFAKKVAEGDFTLKLEIDQADEIGILSRALNQIVSNLNRMLKHVITNTETLFSASGDLTDISQQMTSGAEKTSEKSSTAAVAAEEMSSNINTVAAAMEEASTNVGLVATSAEQMTSVIDEIAKNSEKARTITDGAVIQAKSASERVDELGNAAREISQVTETISEISEQVNLLALNATIEAARAGEAGKGFAVVANEIKELAKQTAEATGEIKKRIEGIQTSTDGTVTEIEQISKVINEVNEIVATIATAVEEQSVTTREIAENVSQASQGISEVAENVTQSSTVTGEIARDISEVNHAAGEMSNSSSQVSMSAQELSKLSDKLKETVGKFKV